MNHRIVTFVVGVIVFLLATTALAFAWSISARVPATLSQSPTTDTPHPVTGANADCIACHARDWKMPVTHRYFTNDSCRSCHFAKPVVLVPHSVSMGNSRCPLCHGDPDSDFGMPRDHLAFKEKRCLFCHEGSAAHAFTAPRPAGPSSRTKPTLTHPVTGAFAHCLYCHRIGSNPSLPRSHEAFAQETCLWCHATTSVAATGAP
jgi:hypothetical protein